MASDSEPLVIEALNIKDRGLKACVISAPQNSFLDKEGVDVLVRIFKYPFWLAIQVKASNTRDTVGLVLPLPGNPSGYLKSVLTPYMVKKAKEHLRKHPHVLHMLFVARSRARPGNLSLKRKDEVLDDIWKEIERIFWLTSKFTPANIRE